MAYIKFSIRAEDQYQLRPCCRKGRDPARPGQSPAVTQARMSHRLTCHGLGKSGPGSLATGPAGERGGVCSAVHAGSWSRRKQDPTLAIRGGVKECVCGAAQHRRMPRVGDHVRRQGAARAEACDCTALPPVGRPPVEQRPPHKRRVEIARRRSIDGKSCQPSAN